MRAREARGARTTVVVSGIPFKVTDSYVPTLMPYLKKYGELDSYHINSSRTIDGKPDGSITFGFFSGGQPLPPLRPSIPIIHHHTYIGAAAARPRPGARPLARAEPRQQLHRLPGRGRAQRARLQGSRRLRR